MTLQPYPTKKMLTTREAADVLQIAEDTVRRYVYRGLIAAHKFGSSLAIDAKEIERFSRERAGKGRPKKVS